MLRKVFQPFFTFILSLSLVDIITLHNSKLTVIFIMAVTHKKIINKIKINLRSNGRAQQQIQNVPRQLWESFLLSILDD